MKLLIGSMIVAAFLGLGEAQQEVGEGSQSSTSPIAADDRLLISAKNVDGPADTLYRVNSDGAITFPLVGAIRAEGLTIPQFEKHLTTQLAEYIRSPQVSVKRFVTRPETIIVAGAFKHPGIHPLSDHRALLDVISAVGGLESTALAIRITHRVGQGQNTWASAADPVSGTGVMRVNLAHLTEDPGLNDNVLIEPQDVLFAETTVPVFLTGEVAKPGSFNIGEKSSLGLMELISLAGGLGKDAAPQKTRVLRPVLDGTRRTEIAVDAKSMLAGRAADFRVLPNDIVIVPRSDGKLRAVATAFRYAGPAALTSLIFFALR